MGGANRSAVRNEVRTGAIRPTQLPMRLRTLGAINAIPKGEGAWYAAVVLSALMHIVAIVLLTQMWLVPQSAPEIVHLETSWSAAEGTPLDVASVLTPADIDRGPEAPGGRSAGSSDNAVLFPSATLFTLPPVASTETPDWSDDWTTSDDAAERVDAAASRIQSGSSGQGKSGAGTATGAGDGQGDGSGAGQFFGLNVTAEKVVFVVDCSSSMNVHNKGDKATRFTRLKQELEKSITGMKPEARFSVVFFNENAIVMPSRRLQAAVPAVQRQALTWIAHVPAEGKTDPRAALSMALQLEPDAIYLLTDGTFNGAIQRDLRRLKQKQASIHTIAFGNRAGEPVLKELAANNQGEYFYVP